jgi:hypothetical protein
MNLYVPRIKAMEDKLRYLLILLCLLFQGCVLPVPWFGDHPYYSKEFIQQSLTVGIAQSNVIHIFGEPNVSWNEEHLMLYAGFEKTFHDLLSQASAGKHHYILIEFDNSNQLKRYDYFVDSHCTSWGLCFDELENNWSYGSFLGFEEQYLVGSAVAIKAPEEKDKIAKNFHSISDECSIYILRRTNPSPPQADTMQGNVSVSRT